MKDDVTLLFKALTFAAEKHRHQRRKDIQSSPYINHPIEVAHLLWTVGDVDDMATIIAALLHDTLEDTDTTSEEIRALFGDEVLGLVLEVSDEKHLPKKERKKRQILHAPNLSEQAKLLKLADKICNIRDIAYSPPKTWPLRRKMDYLRWAEAVIDGLRGVNAPLENHFEHILAEARKKLAAESTI